MKGREISRRTFLKVIGAGAMTVSAMGLNVVGAAADDQNQGQVSAPYVFPDYETYRDPYYPDDKGVFTVNQYFALFCDEPGATIYYTLDGSDPTVSATTRVFNQKMYKAPCGAGGAEVAELIALTDTDPEWDGLAKKTDFNIRAVAMKDGMNPSEIVSFPYTIDRMDKKSFKHRLLYDVDGMRVWMVIDYDSDKIYLIEGANKALVVDTGMAAEGADLYAYVSTITDKPIELFVTHWHGDHIKCIDSFVAAQRPVYMHPIDIPLTVGNTNHPDTVREEHFTPIQDGHLFDLEGVELETILLPGHTDGSIMLLDRKHGLLYSGDAIGCNRRSVADSLTLASNDARVLVSSLELFRKRLNDMGEAGQVDLDKLVAWTGHDDYEIFNVVEHLNVITQAARNIVDYGPDAAFRVSLRNTAGSTGASIAGNRYANGGTGNFICMNGKHSTALSAEDYMTVANLAGIWVQLPGESENYIQSLSTIALAGQDIYSTVPAGTNQIEVLTIPTATAAVVSVNGIQSAGCVTVPVEDAQSRIVITVTAPDGTSTMRYSLIVSRSPS
ncbi:MAG: MBL fold metallo-hydrolase [Clostridia bacterium]|nr:MBL fold metallo-hydrolase [Clostridia bacterium]